jgi:hypothetical protein
MMIYNQILLPSDCAKNLVDFMIMYDCVIFCCNPKSISEMFLFLKFLQKLHIY